MLTLGIIRKMMIEVMKVLMRWRRRRRTFLLKNGLGMWDKMFRGGVAVEKAKAACCHENQT